MPETVSRIGKPIVIAGVERSGTSLIASLVHRWGAYGGDVAQLERGDAGNPRGYFENRELQRFIATHLGVDWWAPDFDGRLEQRTRDSDCLGTARELASAMAGHGETWFWKDPMFCVTLPFWREVWGDAPYIIPIRDPFASVISYQKVTLPAGAPEQVKIVCAYLLRWQHYMLSVLTATRGAGPRLLVSYERLVASPLAEARRIAAFLSASCGVQDRGDEVIEHMAAAVDPQLQRNRSEVDVADRPELSSVQRELYARLQEMIDQPSLELDPLLYPLWPGWREYITNIVVFARYFAYSSMVLKSRPVKLLMALDAARRSLTRRLRSLWRPRRQDLPASPLARRRRTYS